MDRRMSQQSEAAGVSAWEVRGGTEARVLRGERNVEVQASGAMSHDDGNHVGQLKRM